ncbi:16S rRNA (cytosine(1402)-N(4))-methyltransferase, partial [Blastococcus sp. CCUG 61487]|uniref:16S rRNA (cytosine(1402)-N(4))-methyltransferase n=1 Tax=Blastococcus sp. CCUG 61487 TaxID=1840703 RepID=UPI00201D545C
ALAVGGRVAVITFHSLEDRIVKQILAEGATDSTPPGLPVPLPEHGPVLRLLTRGGEAASDAEVAA